MGRPLHADGRQTRLTILDAALDLFAEKGYFGTSLRDIAAVVGIRESAFYNYFRGKDALFDALIVAAQEYKVELLSGLLDEPMTDVRVVLERLTNLVLDHFRERRQQQLFRVLMSDGMRLAKQGRINLIERMTSGEAPFRELMRRLIAEGAVRPRDPELLMLEFMGPLLLWRHWHAIHPNRLLITNRKRFVRDHVDHFLQGATAIPVGREGRASRRHAAQAGRPTARHRRRGTRAAS